MQLHKSAKKLIESMLFDSAFYLDECVKRGIHAGETSPVIHYLTTFSQTGVNPHPLFDSQYYCGQPPVLDEIRLNPLTRYLNQPADDSRSPHPLFDTAYYLQQVPDIQDSGLTPLGHFLAFGAAMFANPNPYFDTRYYCEQQERPLAMNPLVHYLQVGAARRLNPSSRFDTAYYLKQNPDVLSNRYNPLEHFLRFGKSEGRAHFSFFTPRSSGQSREVEIALSESLLNDYQQVRLDEPLLPPSTRLDGLPTIPMPNISRAGQLYFKLSDALKVRFSHLFLMPFLLHGGAEKVSMNFVKCVVDKIDASAPLVLVTDSDDTSAREWLPNGVRLLVLDEIMEDLSIEEKALVVTRLILQSRPQLVLNVNSVVGWELYKKFGRQLSTVTNLAAGLFGYGLDSDGAPDGFAVHHLNHSLDHLRYLFSDTERFRSLLVEQFGFSQRERQKMVVAYSPMSSETDCAENFLQPRTSAENQEVLWAGRLSPGKRPDVLLAVAKALPQLKFHVWGKPDHMPTQLMSDLKAQANISLHGKYESFFKIPLGKCGLFLYTTEGDGLPLVLLEAVASGLPVVAPRIGGISELVRNDTGWLIEHHEDVGAYVSAIGEALGSPEATGVKICNAQNLLRERYVWSSFRDQITSLPQFWGHQSG